MTSVCSACNEVITQDVLWAFNMAWHRTCLVCNICGKDFSDGTQPDEGADGFAYCHNDYVETFIPKCGACGKQIEGQVIEAMAKKMAS